MVASSPARRAESLPEPSLLSPSRPFLATVSLGSAIAFATGIGASRVFGPSPAFVAMPVLAGMAGWFYSRVRRGPSRRALVLRALMLSLFWAGSGAALERGFHSRYLASPLLASPTLAARAEDHAPVLLRGYVEEDPVILRDRKHFLFRVEEAGWKGRWSRAPGKVRISLREGEEKFPLRFGDRLEMPVRLRPPRSFRNPGAFDYGRYLEGEGVHLLGSVKSVRLLRRLPGRGGGLWIPVHRLRARLLRRLARAFPEEADEEPRRFLEAILLGERRGAEGDYERLYRKTGVYHILSISGLHFALLLGAVGRGARLLPGGRRLAPGLLSAAALLYVALSGGEDPILRSALAALFLAAGRLSGRRLTPCDAQAQAGILLLALHPLHLFNPGFQLSFVATLGILASGGTGGFRSRSLQAIRDPLAVSANAWIATLPVLASEFFQISPIALILNLAAAPFLSGSLFLGACLLVIPSGWIAALLHAWLGAFSATCRLALRVPGSFARIPAPPLPVLLAFVALLVTLRISGARAQESTKRRLVITLFAILLCIGYPPERPRPAGELDFLALDVGQGDAILLRLPGGKDILIDGGGFAGTDFDVGEKVVVPALLSLGVRRLELVVLTHAHQDHGGGLPAVLEAFPPREIWMGRAPPRSAFLARIGRAASENGIPVLHPTRGVLRCLGAACLEVLHPPPGYRPGAEVSNDDSLVLRLTYGGSAILLPGDIEREGESLLLASGAPLRSDLLKVSHHGSSSSTSGALLEAAGPDAAVISVGEGNLWGHPSPQVLDRLARRRVSLFRTDRDGAVWISFSEGRWERKALLD